MAKTLLTLVAKLGRDPALQLPPGFRLRTQTRDDAHELAQVWLEAYPASVTETETTLSATTDLLASMSGEYGPFLVAASPMAIDTDNRIVGAVQTVGQAVWEHTPKGPFIVEVFVAPDFRRIGLGRALLSFALTSLQELGHESVGLRVDSENRGANALYCSLGFREWEEPV